LKPESEARSTRILECNKNGSEDYTKCDEIPFDFSRRRLSGVVKRPHAEGIERLLITKGAPEGIVELCDNYQVGPTQRSVDADARTRTRKMYEELCEQGFRVLAVASSDGLLALDARIVLFGHEVCDGELPRAAIRPIPSNTFRGG
jgi:magnesium-transporting ATPase (P-type)